MFSIGLGVASVVLPLLALDAGYSNAMVGVLTGISAVGQIMTRLFLAAAMRRFSEWWLVLFAGVLLSISCGIVATSAALFPFVLAQVLQGAARACFWTGSQTHVVRGNDAPTGPLAVIGFTAGVGMTIGPVIGGLVGGRSLTLALIIAAVVGVVGMVPALFLDRHPPFAKKEASSRPTMWRRPGVGAGCWASVGSGGWRGLLNSYVPVALVQAGHTSTRIGFLIAAANVANMLGTVVVARVRGFWVRASYVLSTAATGVGIGVCAAVAWSSSLVGVALVASGVGAGALQTLSAGIAAEAVPQEDRGDAIATVGTFRAVALFASPLGVGAMLAVIPLGAAMAVLGGLLAAPAFAGRFAPEDGSSRPANLR